MMPQSERIQELEAELASLRDDHPLSAEQIDAIAEKAARRALQIVYAEVGQNVLRKLTWLLGIVIVGMALWLAGKNSLPK